MFLGYRCACCTVHNVHTQNKLLSVCIIGVPMFMYVLKYFCISVHIMYMQAFCDKIRLKLQSTEASATNTLDVYTTSASEGVRVMAVPSHSDLYHVCSGSDVIIVDLKLVSELYSFCSCIGVLFKNSLPVHCQAKRCEVS